MKMIALSSLLVVAACGGPPAKTDQASEGPPRWSGWKEFHKVTTSPWISKTHGKRFVEIYVNDIGLAAYQDEEAELPVGSMVVKQSWENQGGQPGPEGPLFIMEKQEAGYAPDHGDWFYGFEWDAPSEDWQKKLGKPPIIWQSPSKRVDYCWDCHDSYERQLGMPPHANRAWEAAPTETPADPSGGSDQPCGGSDQPCG